MEMLPDVRSSNQLGYIDSSPSTIDIIYLVIGVRV
jgi:hypothetical protein